MSGWLSLWGVRVLKRRVSLSCLNLLGLKARRRMVLDDAIILVTCVGARPLHLPSAFFPRSIQPGAECKRVNCSHVSRRLVFVVRPIPFCIMSSAMKCLSYKQHFINVVHAEIWPESKGPLGNNASLYCFILGLREARAGM